jgi:probable rRNA maturation factor
VAEGFVSGQLSVAVVGDTAMSRLHRRFADTPGPTDVLAFDLGSQPARGHLDAEVILCASFAWRVAQGQLPAARRELALYLVHGILHLAGYEDGTPAGFEAMHTREDQLLSQLGLGPVFRQRARAGRAARRRLGAAPASTPAQVADRPTCLT